MYNQRLHTLLLFGGTVRRMSRRETIGHYKSVNNRSTMKKHFTVFDEKLEIHLIILSFFLQFLFQSVP